MPDTENHPLELEILQEWQVLQVAHGHVAAVLTKALNAWRADRAALAAAAARVASLERKIADLRKLVGAGDEAA